MTVAELIVQLSKLPQDDDVRVSRSGDLRVIYPEDLRLHECTIGADYDYDYDYDGYPIMKDYVLITTFD